MAWVSAYLGSNVTSDYTHIDNLRTDLITGKFWNASGNANIQLFYSGAGYLTVSSGNMYINTKTIFFQQSGYGAEIGVYHSGGSYIGISASGAGIGVQGLVNNHATEPLTLMATSAKVRVQNSGGGGQCKLELYDVGSAVWRSVHISGGAWVIV